MTMVSTISYEIKLVLPDKFKDLVLSMGAFLMTTIVLSYLGKYLRGSGAQKVWPENAMFGVNIGENVMTVQHLKRSLKFERNVTSG